MRAADSAKRALVPTLALVLLIGFVAAASIGIVLMGSEVIETSKSSSETERVESGFVELSKEANTVALADRDSKRVELPLDEEHGAIRKEETGRITVRVSDRSDPIVDRPIGALEYRDGDTVIAYQAGGVWRGQGSESRLVSAPEIHYRHGSLTLPIPTVTGDEALTSETIDVEKTRTISPLNDVSTVEGKVVTVEIESEYYAGWAEYFRTRTADTAVTVDDENQTVVVSLGRPVIDGDFENAVVARGSVQTSGSGCIDGDLVATGSTDGETCDGDELDGDNETVSLEPIDEAINMTVDAAREDGEPIESSTLTNGTYFVEDLERSNEDLTIDVSDGDVTIVVDGHVGLENSELAVVGTGEGDGVARVYTTGDVAIGQGNGGVTVDDDDPSRFQLYGTSQMHFAIGQGEFTGTVYAPREEPADGDNEAADGIIESSNNCEDIDGDSPDVCIGQGNVEFTGSIVAGPMSVEQSSTLEYDTRLETTEPSLAVEGVVMPPPLTHMHVVVHEMNVTNE